MDQKATFRCDPRPLIGPPALDLPACDSRHLPYSCSQPLHLEAQFCGRRISFSTRRHLQITFGTSTSDLAPSPEHPRRAGETHQAEVGAEARPPLEQPGQPWSIRHSAVGRGLARRPARPLLLPLPGAAATATPRFKARLYLALHLPGPAPLQAPLPHRAPSGAGPGTTPRPSFYPPPGCAPAQPLRADPFPRPRAKARDGGSTWPRLQKEASGLHVCGLATLHFTHVNSLRVIVSPVPLFYYFLK
ncbi:translation initiation factor IF-2-like [Meles meles]|uniref:translation initiation factor IF-2-like n=1 Tax=Meles meles TaxID=9662 RepID=UPI001E69E639|nr:translation initiation factor IF-2-like [Meles meles]